MRERKYAFIQCIYYLLKTSFIGDCTEYKLKNTGRSISKTNSLVKQNFRWTKTHDMTITRVLVFMVGSPS